MKQKSPIEELFAPDDEAVEAPAVEAVVPTEALVRPVPVPRIHTLDCGHTNWHSEAVQEQARSEGFCCEGGRKNDVVEWDRLRGKYVRPLPVALRMTWEKAHDTSKWRGFPGYCCNDAGYYIGGVANDCRYYRPKGESVCPAHRPDPPALVSRIAGAEEDEEDGGEEGVVTVAPENPSSIAPRKLTYKDRQNQQRKRKGR